VPFACSFDSQSIILARLLLWILDIHLSTHPSGTAFSFPAVSLFPSALFAAPSSAAVCGSQSLHLALSRTCSQSRLAFLLFASVQGCALFSLNLLSFHLCSFMDSCGCVFPQQSWIFVFHKSLLSRESFGPEPCRTLRKTQDFINCFLFSRRSVERCPIMFSLAWLAWLR
jgi:hypothetical protein